VSGPAEFAVSWQGLVGAGPAYAGAAAPVMMMPARQLAAKILCIMITFLPVRGSRTLIPFKLAQALRLNTSEPRRASLGSRCQRQRHSHSNFAGKLPGHLRVSTGHLHTVP